MWIWSLKDVGSVPASYPASRSSFIFNYVRVMKFRYLLAVISLRKLVDPLVIFSHKLVVFSGFDDGVNAF